MLRKVRGGAWCPFPTTLAPSSPVRFRHAKLLFPFFCGVCYGVCARNGALLRGTLSAEVARGVGRFVGCRGTLS
jgi:hypothetical protein